MAQFQLVIGRCHWFRAILEHSGGGELDDEFDVSVKSHRICLPENKRTKSHAKRPECSMRERFLSGGVVRRTPEYRKDDDAEMHLHILIPGKAH